MLLFFNTFQIEDIITKMQDDKTGGVAIRTVKSFLSKIPSVVTGKIFLTKGQQQTIEGYCRIL